MNGFRSVFALLCWEAAFAVAYENWVGSAYLVGLAGELGIDLGLLSFLAAIPCIGAVGQLLGVAAFDRQTSTKRFVLTLDGIGRGVWALPIGLAAYGAWAARHAAPRVGVMTWFWVAAASACFSAVLTSASANAWMHWMRELVPSRFHGRFFARRQQFTMGTIVVAGAASSFLVEWRPEGLRVGYAVMGALALVAAATSWVLHARIPDKPAADTGVLAHAPRGLRELVATPLANAEFRRLMYFGMAFSGGIHLASAYFPYYFTHDVGVSMGRLAVWGTVSSVGSLLAAGYWGKRADRSRRPYEILWWAGLFVSAAPLAYVFGTGTARWLAPIEYLSTGVAWSGFLIAQTTLLMRLSPPRDAVAYFSVFAAACGLGDTACTFLGGQLAHWLPPNVGFAGVFAASAAWRLTALIVFCRPLLAASRAESRTYPRVA